MSGRYEIIDILSQDAEGVVFHAEDRETGAEVALRRFFPFGAEGGGLASEERQAYEIGVRRLMEISHPALRRVLDGGTDPVDGMPFLVTEWLPGSPLAERLHERPLSPGSARALVETAIDTSLILSQAFQEEAVWIDTHPQSIILGEPGDERTLTFWISPLRWLADADSRRGLRPLLEMTEQVLGWQGRVISATSGEGLGAWVKALRQNPDRWSLEEARGALHQLQSEEAGPASIVPPAAEAPVPPRESRPSIVVMVKPNPWPWIASAALAVAAAAFFWSQSGSEPASEPAVAGETEESAGASEPAQAVAVPGPPTPAGAPNLDFEEKARRFAEERKRNIILIRGEELAATGRITDTYQTKKTSYLKVRLEDSETSVWTRVRRSDWNDFDHDDVGQWVGREVTFAGEVQGESSPRQEVVVITGPAGWKLAGVPR